MRKRTQTLIKGQWLSLTKQANPATGKSKYIISIDQRRVPAVKDRMQYDILAEMRNHFDPGKNRGISGGTKWHFRDKETAMQLITMALIKWG